MVHEYINYETYWLFLYTFTRSEAKSTMYLCMIRDKHAHPLAASFQTLVILAGGGAYIDYRRCAT